MRHSYYKDEDFEVMVEKADERIYVHVGIERASKEVVRRIKGVWGSVVMAVYADGYDALYTYTQDSRIVKMIGGAEHIGNTDVYEVYKWDLA